MFLFTITIFIIFHAQAAFECKRNPSAKEGCSYDCTVFETQPECDEYLMVNLQSSKSSMLPTMCLGVYPCKWRQVKSKTGGAAAPADQSGAATKGNQVLIPNPYPGNGPAFIPAPAGPKRPTFAEPLDPVGCGTNVAQRITCQCSKWASGTCQGKPDIKLDCGSMVRDRRRDGACVKEESMEWCCGSDQTSVLARTGVLGGREKYDGRVQGTEKKVAKAIIRSHYKPHILLGSIVCCLIILSLLTVYSNCKYSLDDEYDILENEI